MQIVFLKTLATVRETFAAGHTYDLPEERAKQFIGEGNAVLPEDFKPRKRKATLPKTKQETPEKPRFYPNPGDPPSYRDIRGKKS